MYDEFDLENISKKIQRFQTLLTPLIRLSLKASTMNIWLLVIKHEIYFKFYNHIRVIMIMFGHYLFIFQSKQFDSIIEYGRAQPQIKKVQMCHKLEKIMLVQIIVNVDPTLD